MGPLILLLPIFLPTLSSADAATAPVLSKPLTSQLFPANPSISSAFLLPLSSALLANVSGPFPALRIPPSWSFSIGFSGDTFLPPPGTSQRLSFMAQLDSGDPIPDWLVFEQDTITFGGVTPKPNGGIQVLKVVVIASTTSNVTTSDAFTLIVSPHDLSLSGPLLTRNVTANNAFRIVLDDWEGVQVDGAPVNLSIPSTSGSANLSLSLDTSSLPWLNYEPSSCVLSGTPPTDTPMASIPALVKLTFSQTTQYLVVSTNLTIIIVRSIFTTPNLPEMSAPVGSQIAFALTPYLNIHQPSASQKRRRTDQIATSVPNLNFSAQWDPQNATWLAFDSSTLLLNGTVPQDAPREVKVTFQAQDVTRGTISRAQLHISIYQEGGDGQGRLPTDTLRRTGKRIKLAVGVVFGVAAAVIVLACFLAVCRHCCVAREKVDGAYVIEQSAFGQDPAYKSSLEKDDYTSPSADVAYAGYLSPCSSPQPTASPGLGRTMTKAAFFNAVRTRFGSDGSWRTRRNLERNRSASSESSEVNADNDSGGVRFGSGKRPRKSKISKPMGMVSSSTSIRDGFAEHGRSGVASVVNGKGRGTAVNNFTIFGGGNNARGGNEREIAPGNGGKTNNGPLLRSPRPDISHAVGRILMSSPGTAILAYDRSRSHSDPSRNSVHGSAGTGEGVYKRQSGSASAPSLGTGTHSGTQSTFETGDSTRLTNAAGEVPFRRSGFDGRWETLGERSMRQKLSPLAEGCVDIVGISSGDPDPGPSVPLSALGKGDEVVIPTSSLRRGTSKADPHESPAVTPPKPAISSTTVPPTSNSGTVSTSNMPAKSIHPNKSGSKRSPLNPKTNDPAKLRPSQPLCIRTKPGASFLNPGSDTSLGAAASSYKEVFFGDRDIESDSSTEDVENAVITHVVNRSSSETPVTSDAVQTPTKAGRPRLVAFTHERTTPVSGQGPRRDVSQRAVLQGDEESDAEAEMRIGLEYVRQLGDPDPNNELAHANGAINSRPFTSRVSFASDTTRTPQAEFYASNDSNNSIAGRSRVLAPLVINSHRNRHQAIHSTGSIHDSFLSLVDREGEPRESRWMVESTLPRFAFSAKEPFNFAVPLDSQHKHASVLAGSALEAKQSDGSPLPEWLRFEKGGKEFWGVTPKATKGEKGKMLVTRVIVTIWDGEKGEVVGGCVVDVLGDRE